jgi:hypothetical protein
MMADSIVAIRMTRNLRYKLTYIEIFKSYMEPDPGIQVLELLKSLIQAQQSAIAPLSSYLRRLDVKLQDLDLDQKLMGHAENRRDVKSRLRFVQGGLSRAVSWYQMQLVDRQMTADPELKNLLFELGEIDAAQLWRTEATMAMLRISLDAKQKQFSEQQRSAPIQDDEDWSPRLVEDVSRPSWSGGGPSRWSKGYRSNRKDR